MTAPIPDSETLRKILVVEDDRDVRETVIEALEDQGWLAVGVEDGAEALAWLSQNTAPALILLDLMMPRMNGAQFRSAQLADGGLADIPVVLLSADATLEQKARSLGTAGYLRKPVKLASLLDVAERFVPQRG